MSIATLFEKGPAAYFESESDRPGDLWLFLHIPKTAGSSFRSELAAALTPNHNIVVDYLDGSLPFEAKRNAAVSAFIARQTESPCRFASGHLRMRHVNMIQDQLPSTKVIAMLRNPTHRLISDYRYQMTDVHPLHESFRKRYPTLEHYLDDPASHNKICSFLQLRANEGLPELIARVEEKFSFVGLVETYPLSFRTMFALLGMDRRPSVHERKNTGKEVKLDDQLMTKLEDANSKDMVIYRHFRKRLLESKEAMWSHLATFAADARKNTEPAPMAKTA